MGTQKVIRIPVVTSERDCPEGKPNAPKAQAQHEPRQPLQLLLAENSIHDELAIITELHQGGFEVVHRRVETVQGFIKQLEAQSWDLIICDYRLRECGGPALLEICRRCAPNIPFVMVSSVIGEEVAVETLKAGAGDYVMKQNLSRLVPAVRRELQRCQERQLRRRTEAFQEYLCSVIESCQDAIIGQTLDGTIVSWNQGAERLFGYVAGEIIGRSASVLMPKFGAETGTELLDQVGKTVPVESLFAVRRHKDGSAIQVSLSVSPVKDAAGRVIGSATVARNATAWREEENLRLSLIQELTSALAVNIHHVESGGAGSQLRLGR